MEKMHRYSVFMVKLTALNLLMFIGYMVVASIVPSSQAVDKSNQPVPPTHTYSDYASFIAPMTGLTFQSHDCHVLE
jgi:hypothetical protein